MLFTTPPERVKILSVLSVEPYGMKPKITELTKLVQSAFSALGRAVWDETAAKIASGSTPRSFSALGRAVWDETFALTQKRTARNTFQCSRSSRMG